MGEGRGVLRRERRTPDHSVQEQQREQGRGDDDAIPAEENERMGLYVSEQPFDRREGDNGGDNEADRKEAPVFSDMAIGVPQGFENFQGTSGQHSRDSD